MVASGPRSADRPAPLRLTRRGRIVVILFFVLVASVVGGLLATASRASDPAGEVPVDGVVVQPYDTLWSIASRAVPDRAPRPVIAEIRRLNGLPDYTVHPGEWLWVPGS